MSMIISLLRIADSPPEMSSLSRYERRSEVAESPEPSNYGVHSKRLRRDLEEMKINPPAYVYACLKGDNLYEWKATIEGPPDSPYEGGIFLLDIIFPQGYPFKPPRVTFRTKIYHCNINCEGWISIDILHSTWMPSLTVEKLLLSIQSFLIDCNPDDPLVPEIADQYVKNREEHDKICREWTKKYANKKDVIRKFFMV